MLSKSPRFLLLLSLLTTIHSVKAHPHHAHPDEIDNSVPIDAILYLHVFVQLLSWGILFPFGMILGLTKSRFHVPVQSVAVILSFFGYFLGHHHGGRQFPETAHGHFASLLFWILIAQTGIGIYLKLHLKWGEEKIRPVLVKIHGLFGRVFPVLGWVQIVFGFIAGLGMCFGDHLGQCLAHFIMGSSLIGYGIILLLMIRAGAAFLARKNCSQEYLDSWVIMIFGFVNTFTEHDFLSTSGHWSHKDMQHTSLFVVWWMGGALGIWLGRNRKRNLVPAGILALTGFAMSAHEQSSMMSTKVHTAFGYALILAGLARAVEICFIMREGHIPPSSQVNDDNQNGNDNNNDPPESAFQHVTPFFLVVGGLTIMSATEEQIKMVEDGGMDHVTYILILVSGAFIIYLFSSLLIALYNNSGRNAPPPTSSENGRAGTIKTLWTVFKSLFKNDTNNTGSSSNNSYELVNSPPRQKVFDVGDDDSELGDGYWTEEHTPQ